MDVFFVALCVQLLIKLVHILVNRVTSLHEIALNILFLPNLTLWVKSAFFIVLIKFKLICRFRPTYLLLPGNSSILVFSFKIEIDQPFLRAMREIFVLTSFWLLAVLIGTLVWIKIFFVHFLEEHHGLHAFRWLQIRVHLCLSIQFTPWYVSFLIGLILIMIMVMRWFVMVSMVMVELRLRFLFLKQV